MPASRSLLTCAALALPFSVAMAAEDTTEGAAGGPADSALTKAERSPWLLAPVFQGNPKLGASFGLLAGYLHNFDERSRPSIFALTAQYTSTDSAIAGAFGKASFDEDHQRLLAALAYGNVKNDYDDYLGTGIPLRNEAELRSLILRYTYRVAGDWFVGAQGIYQDFAVDGDTVTDDAIMEAIGLVPFETSGAGFVVQNDSRDDENMPTRGWLANLNNMAFRESLGGDHDYEVYRIDFRYYHSQAGGHVLALRQLNHLTDDAPAAARAPVQLRGYKIGQYTSRYMSSIEAEERFRLGAKFSATVFAGAGWLYGGERSTADELYPAVGGGLQYILKPVQGIVLNLEGAAGRDDNYGIYVKLGYAY